MSHRVLSRVCRTIVAVAGVLTIGHEAAAAPFAYIANTGSDTISVIDTATDAVSATIDATSVGVNEWGGIVVHPNLPRLYFTGDNTDVGIVDTSTNTVIGSIDLDWYPSRLAVNRAGTRLYAAKQGGFFAVIDTSNNAVLAYQAGRAQRGIAVLPNNLKIYGTSDADGDLLVTDAAPPYSTGPDIGVALYTHEIASSPDSTKMYVVTHPSASSLVLGFLKTVDLTAGAVTGTVNLGYAPTGVAVSPSGDRVYAPSLVSSLCCTNQGQVTVVNPATNSVVATVPVGRNPQGVWVHPTGSKVYVVNFCPTNPAESCYTTTQNGTVSVIDAATNTVTTTIEVGRQPKAFGEFIPPPCAGCCS